MQQLNDDQGKKLDWMYKKPGQTVNHEEYLLGRSIDKEFETLAQEERSKNQIDLGLPPKNHVEHECVPFSIRSYRDAPQEQVDIARKLQEDPLVLIKKYEIESRQQLLQNPVKLKELHRILKEERMKKTKKKKKKTSKDENQVKKTKRKHKSLNLGEDEKNLDDILAEKYAKLKATLDETLDMDSLLKVKKYKTSSYNSDESSDEKSKSYQKKRGHDERGKNKRNDGSNQEESHHNYAKINKSKTKENPDRQKHNEEYDKYRNRHRYSNKEDLSDSMRRYSSNTHGTHRSHEYNKHRSDDSHEKNSYHNRNYDKTDNYNENAKKHEGYKERIPSRSQNEEKSTQKNYGLVSAEGERIELKRNTNIKEKRTETKTVAPYKQRVTMKRPKLTEEEIEKKRKEMYENALWRDKQLETNIKRYKEDEQKEQKLNNSTYDTEFLKKQLAKAADIGSLESRIKSNINNIQRSGGAMDRNFAKR